MPTPPLIDDAPKPDDAPVAMRPRVGGFDEVLQAAQARLTEPRCLSLQARLVRKMPQAWGRGGSAGRRRGAEAARKE